MPVLRHIAAILILPFVMALLIPALIITQTETYNPGCGLVFPANLIPVVTGTLSIGLGLALAAVTINLFGTVGEGTLAPWDPTQHLVITGVYRYVRNPMISGVTAVLIGEAILFGSAPLLVWTLAFMAVNAVYIPLVEEPGLRQRFGADYEEYARHVPRWWPRRAPWMPPEPQFPTD